MPLDELRILDFYLVFPFLIDHIRLMPKHRSYRNLARDYAQTRPYSEQPEDRVVFERMRPIQVAALETLAVNELLDLRALKAGRAQATEKEPSPDLSRRIMAANEHDGPLLNFLGVLAKDYLFEGPGGLKDRTGLLEYRYDSV